MKNSFIKFFSIFLILLFCLSPLGAIDLGQGDNSSQINNKGTGFKDLNDTVIAEDDNDDNDMEIKSNNKTDDKKTIDKNVKIQSVSLNDSNSTKKLQAHDPKLSMEIEDSVYGEAAIVKIIFGDKGFGYCYNNKIRIKGVDNGIRETKEVSAFKGGCNIVKLRDDLPIGKYYIEYNFYSPWYYNNVTVGGYLTVHKRDPAIECSVADVRYGKAPVIKTKCDEHLENKYVYITSPQFSKEYKFDASQGNNEITIDENLLPGKYTFNVFYPGDSIHDTQNKTVTFTVYQLDANLTAVAKKARVLPGEKLYIEIHANNTINADVKCSVKDNTQTVHLVNGVGYVTIDCSGLSPGNYVVSTLLEGHEIFYKDLVLTHFRVMGDSNLRIHVDDSNNRNEKLHVVVDANEEFSGNATITLNNRVWLNKIEIINGHEEGYYAGGDYPGTYTANAKVDEADFFIADNCSTTYEVKDL